MHTYSHQIIATKWSSLTRYVAAIGGLTAVFVQAATAQTAPTVSPAPNEEEITEIVVTGSAIRGAAPTGSELTTISSADIALTDATTGTELLRSVPELNSFNATGPNTGSNQANFVDQPAIHGIGVGNGGAGLTLVLFDGHRLPGAGINQSAPDAGVIPISALDRVEVMADGGSSIYGSDAVAGVINFIPKKNFDGAETSGQGGFGNGYDTTHFTQLLGKTWSGGSILFDYEYSANTALNGTARSYVVNDQIPYGGQDTRSSTCTPANVTAGGLNFALSATGAPIAGATNHCEANRANDLYPQQHRNQFYLALRQQVNDNIELYANMLYSDRTMLDHVAGSGVTTGALSVTVPSTSPYYIALPGVAAGTPESVTYNPASDFGPTFTNRITTTTSSSVVGANFRLPHDWSAKLELNYGLEHDDVNEVGINQGVATSAAAAGTFNPYGAGSATNPAVLAAIGDFDTRYTARQVVQEEQLKFDGPLAALPGGEMKAAVGVDARKEVFDGFTSTGPNEGPISPYSADGSRSSYSGYVELFTPLVGAANQFTGVRKLDVSLSGRFDHYSDVGSTTNPKLGINWTVVDGLLVRASAGRSFHAPSLADAPTAIDTRVIAFPCIPGAFIGCANATPANYTAIIAGGNKLKPETARTYNLGIDFTPVLLDGFKASATYFRVNYDNVITFPTFAPVTNPNTAYDKYRYLESAYSPSAWAAEVATLLNGFRDQGNAYPANPQLPTAIYDLRRQNFANELINGIDYDFGYKFDTALGKFLADLAGTQMMTFYQKIPGVSASVPLLNTDYAVRTKLRASLGWTQGPWSASAFFNYTGGYQNLNVTPIQQVGSFETVDLRVGWVLPDEGLLKGTQLTVGIDNAFNRNPPTFYTSGTNGIVGFDPTAASALGRVVMVGVRKKW
jgi:iron complex outermembrane receptor protein